MKREVLVGATGATGTSMQFPLLLNALIGTKFKPITGYPDSGAVGLAMERGELEGYCSFTWGSIKSARPQWVKDKLIAIILQLTLRKHPELPHVPLVMDYARDEGARQAFALAFADQEIARPIVAPPDVPRERAAALRTAFDDTMQDKEFLADAAPHQHRYRCRECEGVRRSAGADLRDAAGGDRAGQGDLWAEADEVERRHGVVQSFRTPCAPWR